MEMPSAGVPHWGQKFSPGSSFSPHSVQKRWTSIFAPQAPQNFVQSRRDALHLVQFSAASLLKADYNSKNVETGESVWSDPYKND